MKVNLLQPERPPPSPEIHAFVAVHYDDDLLDEVAALAERLRGDARLSGATWYDPNFYRSTIQFFLRTTEAQRARLLAFVDELAAMVSSSSSGPALVRPARVNGLISAAEALVVVLDVEDVPPGTVLTALRARAEAEHIAFGHAPSTLLRPLSLLLARVRSPVDVSDLAGEAASLPTGRLTAISLYVSSAVQIGDVHNRYDRVMTVPLSPDVEP